MSSDITRPQLVDDIVVEAAADITGMYYFASVPIANLLLKDWVSVETDLTAVPETLAKLGRAGKRCGAATDIPIGVLTETPRNDGTNTIAGFYKCTKRGTVNNAKTGGSVTIGQALKLGAAGIVETATIGTDHIVAYALETDVGTTCKVWVIC